ncbi:MAG: DUF962 domain-containing protein [Alteromonadaceae bacterium]|nr:DUF962 domain-containing protein [Alteromonadaceae bacterium]
MAQSNFNSFQDFYRYYLSEHDNSICRGLHYFSSSLVLISSIGIIATHSWLLLWFLPLIGYGPAWIGHFFFEKNKPATFQFPLYSFISDWVMLKGAVTGQLAEKLRLAKQTHKINN